MPFKSKAQQRFMFATMPETAREWAHHTPDIKGLPNKITSSDPAKTKARHKPKKQRRKAARFNITPKKVASAPARRMPKFDARGLLHTIISSHPPAQNTKISAQQGPTSPKLDAQGDLSVLGAATVTTEKQARQHEHATAVLTDVQRRAKTAAAMLMGATIAEYVKQTTAGGVQSNAPSGDQPAGKKAAAVDGAVAGAGAGIALTGAVERSQNFAPAAHQPFQARKPAHQQTTKAALAGLAMQPQLPQPMPSLGQAQQAMQNFLSKPPVGPAGSGLLSNGLDAPNAQDGRTDPQQQPPAAPQGTATAIPGMAGTAAANPIDMHGPLDPRGLALDGNHAAGVQKGFKVAEWFRGKRLIKQALGQFGLQGPTPQEFKPELHELVQRLGGMDPAEEPSAEAVPELRKQLGYRWYHRNPDAIDVSTNSIAQQYHLEDLAARKWIEEEAARLRENPPVPRKNPPKAPWPDITGMDELGELLGRLALAVGGEKRAKVFPFRELGADPDFQYHARDICPECEKIASRGGHCQSCGCTWRLKRSTAEKRAEPPWLRSLRKWMLPVAGTAAAGTVAGTALNANSKLNETYPHLRSIVGDAGTAAQQAKETMGQVHAAAPKVISNAQAASSQANQAASQANKAVSGAAASLDPWSNVVGPAAGMLAGGVGAHYLQKWLGGEDDKPTDTMLGTLAGTGLGGAAGYFGGTPQGRQMVMDALKRVTSRT